jgi:hypothetical protein
MIENPTTLMSRNYRRALAGNVRCPQCTHYATSPCYKRGRCELTSCWGKGMFWLLDPVAKTNTCNSATAVIIEIPELKESIQGAQNA